MNLASAIDSVFIYNLTEITLANLEDEKFGVRQLVEKTGLSHFVIRHRVKAITKKTISQFIVEIRLQKAMEILQNEAVTSSEAAYRVGFGSPNYFNKCFHEFYGYPPGDVRRKSDSKFENISPESVAPVQYTTVKKLHKPGREKQWLRTLILIVTGIITVIILAYLTDSFIFNRNKVSDILLKNKEKSIAVLPFLNDSPDSTTQYFIDGMRDVISNNLGKISALTVISRTSVEQFRNTNLPVREIAKRLNVNYILEGSGQKYGSTLILRVQLITTDKEKNLWGETYKQEIKEVRDYIRVQSMIAENVAVKLEAIITPQEEELIRQIPTDNQLAYDYYLRGIRYANEEGLNFSAIDMYNKAIEHDPEFALAYLARANVCSMIYGLKLGGVRNWEGKDLLAKADLERAIKLNPDIPEVKLAKSVQLYRISRKNDEALKLLDEIKPQMVNNPVFLYLRGALLRRNGLWQESIEEMVKASRLDPLAGGRYAEIGRSLMWIRKYKDATDYLSKPDSLGLRSLSVAPHLKFLTSVLWKGDLESALETYKFRNTYSDFYYNRQFTRLIPLAKGSENDWYYLPRTLNLAQIYFLTGNMLLSKLYADSSIVELNLRIKEIPDDDRYYVALGYAYAFKGDQQKAVYNAEKAINLRPLKTDALVGFERELDLGKIYIFTAEYNLAMDKIEYLLTIPGDLSVPLLKIDPFYDKLRDLSRFQKILATEYKTNYK